MSTLILMFTQIVMIQLYQYSRFQILVSMFKHPHTCSRIILRVVCSRSERIEPTTHVIQISLYWRAEWGSMVRLWTMKYVTELIEINSMALQKQLWLSLNDSQWLKHCTKSNILRSTFCTVHEILCISQSGNKITSISTVQVRWRRDYDYRGHDSDIYRIYFPKEVFRNHSFSYCLITLYLLISSEMLIVSQSYLAIVHHRSSWPNKLNIELADILPEYIICQLESRVPKM